MFITTVRWWCWTVCARARAAIRNYCSNFVAKNPLDDNGGVGFRGWWSWWCLCRCAVTIAYVCYAPVQTVGEGVAAAVVTAASRGVGGLLQATRVCGGLDGVDEPSFISL